MKPAFSVILLTTLIGAGQGLFLAYYSADLLALLSILPVESIHGAGRAGLLSLALLCAGLAASFFHLGHPERAWRAITMWRTSWLSREVIALPLAMSLILLYAWLKLSVNQAQISMLVGLVATCTVLLLFLCTAMIYATLKFLRQWHSPLTVLNFLLMGSASGFTLATLMSTHYDPPLFEYFSRSAVVLTMAALLSRLASLFRNKNLRQLSTVQSAIGIHQPTIRQIAQGAMGGSYNTRTFIHAYGATMIKLARYFFLLAGFILPVILLLVSDKNALAVCALAFTVQYAGLLVERWYFFIEAKHPQNIYYQMIS